MLHVYQSNDLDILKTKLLALLQQATLFDPFAKEIILVQSPGMAHWLKIKLAEDQGVVANTDFPLPASFIWNIFTQLLPEIPDQSAFNKEAMTWQLMHLLPKLLSQPDFTSLQDYLTAEDSDFKCYQLSSKIADIFDQYLVYRPEWINAWEQGEILGAEDYPWQPILWRELVQQIKTQGHSDWHRVNMFDAFVAKLNQAESLELPERLFVFGISALPNNYVLALQALSEHMDVYLMLSNPCQQYWSEIVDQKQIAKIKRQKQQSSSDADDFHEQGNPLLASMGKLGQDYFRQLYAVDMLDLAEDYFTEQQPNNLLAHIQDDILQLRDATEFEPEDVINPQDNSILLQGCHSPLREVEVLHDQLLSLFEQKNQLKPSDIVVMMPDVSTYAPYIEAIFAKYAGTNRYIPFSISDRSQQQENPILASLLSFIGVANNRLISADMLALLEVPAVLRRLNIDKTELDKIRQWVSETNIRWGLDKQHKKQWNLPEFEQNTWVFGLKRMLAGYALNDSNQLWQGIAPYAEIEGLEAGALGKLADFVEILEFCLERFQAKKSPEQWLIDIHQLLDLAYLPLDEEEEVLNHARQVVQKLQTQLDQAHWQDDLNLDILIDYLQQQFNQTASSQRFMLGSVNFCTLMPMRSIPFKVVCLLGMNEGAYPRVVAPLGFDLMAYDKKIGDRSRREDDRYLFLEALLAAGEHFYISYISRSIRDNQEQFPSVLVRELLAYIDQGYQLNGTDEQAELLSEHLFQQQLLTAFSPEYFQTESQYFSYAQEWLLQPMEASKQNTTLVVEALSAELETEQFIRFFKQPCDQFFKQRLKVYFSKFEQTEDREAEPFSIDHLTNYSLQNEYLEALLRDEDQSSLDQARLAQGYLPVGEQAQTVLKQVYQHVETLAQRVEPWLQQPAQSKPIAIDLESCRLVGWQNNWYGLNLIHYRSVKKIKAKDCLTTWFEHLFACAGGLEPQASYYFCLADEYVKFKTLTQAEAMAELERLSVLYQQGLQQPLAFEPELAWQYCKKLEKSQEQADKQLAADFYGGMHKTGLNQNLYIARAFPNYEEFALEAKRLCPLIFSAVLAQMELIKHD